MNVILDRVSFIEANTEVLAPPLVPEIKLRLAHEILPIWQSSEEQLGKIGLPPPFWAFAWAGGQALARHVLDHPELVRGQHVIDLASGSGLVAIAATMAGATAVIAADIDGFAARAIALNAALNNCKIDVVQRDLLIEPPPFCGAILVGDLFYEQSLAARALGWLRRASEQGTAVLIGDPGRSYLPKDALDKVAEYRVPVTRELEDAEIKCTAVWTLKQD
jgi:predicted nicotinamide N-methyase